jgi:DNA recombination protein RmuC
MNDLIVVLAAIFACISAVFSILAFIRSGKKVDTSGLTQDGIALLLRNEVDKLRQSSDEQSRGLRQELRETLKGFQDSTLKAFKDLSDLIGNQVKDFGAKLDGGITTVADKATSIATKLDQEMKRMGEEAGQNRETLRRTIESKLDEAAGKQGSAAKELREEMGASFERLGKTVSDTLQQLSLQQKERLENVIITVGALTEKQEKAQEGLKQTVEGRLDALRSDNAAKLEEMRKTVDEKLQTTLETRLGESFTRVVEQLERVHKGIGEMQSLAAGVGDLKKVLSNVRVRGTLGEVHLEMLLEQILSVEQFVKNAQVKQHSQERVEFAIKLPGRDGIGSEVLLPVDAKFPQVDYEKLLVAADEGDAEGIAEASKALDTQIKSYAKSIKEKYISPPQTTDFAILFLPTEGLFAEALRRPGLFDQLQRDYHVTLTGPTTLTAFLSALQMGFRSLALEKRSSEVWQILGAVHSEFGKYNKVVETLSRQLNTAANSVNQLGIRTRAMTRKLKDVEKLPDGTAEAVLGPAFSQEAGEIEEQLAETAAVAPPTEWKKIE